MKWNDKTPKQYDAYATLVMGGENDKEFYLTEDQFNVIWACVKTVEDWCDEKPTPNEKQTWKAWKDHFEGMSWDRNLMSEVLEYLENSDMDHVDIEPIKITELDLKRIETGRVTPEEMLEMKKRQIINQNIKELTDG